MIVCYFVLYSIIVVTLGKQAAWRLKEKKKKIKPHCRAAIKMHVKLSIILPISGRSKASTRQIQIYIGVGVSLLRFKYRATQRNCSTNVMVQNGSSKCFFKYEIFYKKVKVKIVIVVVWCRRASGGRGGGSRGSGPLPIFDIVQIVPSNSSTNLEETMYKISLKNERIHQKDVPTAFSWSFSTLLYKGY